MRGSYTRGRPSREAAVSGRRACNRTGTAVIWGKRCSVGMAAGWPRPIGQEATGWYQQRHQKVWFFRAECARGGAGWQRGMSLGREWTIR